MERIFGSAEALKQHLPEGKTFTLVGGCFDLLHVGHIHLLESASALEEVLVVAVLSDQNVREYKKSGRPVIPQAQRARMLASMRVVDFVFISDVNPNGAETIGLLKPDSIVFGDDLSPEKIARWTANVERSSPQTKIRSLPRYTDENVSTTNIIKRIQNMVV